MTYVEGAADRVKLIADRAAAGAEIARVLGPGGRLLIVSHFRGEPTPRAWSAFPEAREIEERSLPSVDEAKAMLAPAGVRFVALDRQLITVCPSLRTYMERVKLRSISSLECPSDVDFAAGVAAMEADVAARRFPNPVRQLADLWSFRPKSPWTA